MGREMEEMRWFLVPYEAHLYLTGSSRPPSIRVPFQPRDYEGDNWYDSQYLDEWDRHWNPAYWKEVEEQRNSGQFSSYYVAPTCRWQWTIYPANQSPVPMIQLQPVTEKVGGGQLLVRRKKAFASLECLYSEEMKIESVGSMGSLESPLSSGYSSDGDRGEDTGEVREVREVRRRRRRRSKLRVSSQSHDSLSGKKCIVM